MMLAHSHKLRLALKEQEALKVADATVMAYPKSVEALIARADILKELGFMKEATADLGLAHKLAPANMEVLRKHSRMLDLTGQLVEAIQEYDVILKATPNDSSTWCYRAGANKRLKRYAAAAVDFRNAVKVDLKNRSAGDWMFEVGDCFFLAGNMTEALKAFDILAKAYPEASSAYWGRAKTLEKLGRPKEAAVDREKAKKIDLEFIPHDSL